MNATFDPITGIVTFATTNVGISSTGTTTVLKGTTSMIENGVLDGNEVQY